MARQGIIQAYVDWSDDTLEAEFDKAFDLIKNNIDFTVLGMVGSEMMNDLQKHINDDVYSKYSPKSYPRRKDHPEFGTPLDSEKNFSIHAKNNILEFDYNPDGTHKGKMKDALDFDGDPDSDSANEPLKPHPVHGDVLINRIQTGKGYDWKESMEERPFWSNFVEEEFNGKLIDHFNYAVRHTPMTSGKYDYKYFKASIADLTREGNDGELSTEKTWDISTYDDDDLPF